MQVDIDHLYKVINELNCKISDQSTQLQILKFRVESSDQNNDLNEGPITRRSGQNLS